MEGEIYSISRRRFTQLLSGGAMLSLLLEACGSPAPTTPTAAAPTVAAAKPTAAAATPLSTAAPAAQPTLAAAPAAQPTVAAAPAATGASSVSLKLPTFMPFQGPAPDLPGDARGIEPAYFSFPKNLVPAWTDPNPPGQGDVTAFVGYTQTPPLPVDQNTQWQAINKALGANLKVNFASLTDYPTKMATVVAGDDIPDYLWMYLSPTVVVPQLPDFLAAKMADLTPYLSGDAIKDYPSLANIPPLSWKNGVFNNRLYALPAGVNPPFSNLLMYRQDLLDQAGVSMATNADDFKKMLQAVSNPQQNRYALGVSPTNAMGMIAGSPFLAMFGAPNNWAVDANGAFTKDFETDGYKAALAYLRDLWASGVISPNSPSYQASAQTNDFYAGRLVFSATVLGGYRLFWSQAYGINKDIKMRIVPPIAHDGGKPIFHLGNGAFGLTFLKQAPADRIRMQLRMSDYLAAPFGSKERLLIKWGIEGVHYSFNADGNPIPTQKGLTEIVISWNFIGPVGQVVYDPTDSQEFATVMNAAERAMMDVGINDPTVGLYSGLNAQSGTPLTMAVNDGVTDIILGRRPMSDFDQLVKDWRSKGGDKIRAEYQQLYATTKFS